MDIFNTRPFDIFVAFDSAINVTSSIHTTASYINIGFCTAAFLTALAGNSMILFAYVKDPYKNLQTVPSNLLVATLAFVDILSGVFFLFLYILLQTLMSIPSKIDISYIHWQARFFGPVSVCLSLASLFLLVAMAIDRYFAVTRPLAYKSLVTKQRIIWAIFSIVLYSLASFTLFLLNPGWFLFSMFFVGSHLVLAAFLMSCLYIRIMVSIRRQSRAISQSADTNIHARRLMLAREKKVLVAVVIVLSLFLFSFIPCYITTLFLVVCSTCLSYKFAIALLFSVSLFNSTCAFNPFVYGIRVDKFRQAIGYYSCSKT
ncbi:adenosine receptor A1 [Nematostella vectensis]|uniref:adenosine receptor A1 n=1 Tax=Nematostella vectensis TaxID=45351 RepID=UPI002076DECD|nr:adenosine receptor A1 [Nematostella vectensis]